MLLLQQLERLQRMHQLIKLKATGSPQEFANKLQISKSTLFEYFDVLKEMGGQIEYSRIRQTYFYLEKVEFHIGFSNSESLQIRGGNASFSIFRKYRNKLNYYYTAFK